MEGRIGIAMAEDLEEEHNPDMEVEQVPQHMDYSKTVAMEEVPGEERVIGKVEGREGENNHCYCYCFGASCLSCFLLD